MMDDSTISFFFALLFGGAAGAVVAIASMIEQPLFQIVAYISLGLLCTAAEVFAVTTALELSK